MALKSIPPSTVRRRTLNLCLLLLYDLTSYIDAELVLHLAISVVEDTPVGALVLLLEALDPEDGQVVRAVRPLLEPASLHGEVLEALEPLHLWRGVSPYL